VWDENGRAVKCSSCPGFSCKAFLKGANLPRMGWYVHSWIQQESTFWRRSLWERAGGYVDSSRSLAADFELWARFWQHGELYGVSTPLAGFRLQKNQKTASHMDEYLQEAGGILRLYGGRPYGRLETILRHRFGHLLPIFIRPYLVSLGVTYAAKTLVHRGRLGGWSIETTYLV